MTNPWIIEWRQGKGLLGEAREEKPRRKEETSKNQEAGEKKMNKPTPQELAFFPAKRRKAKGEEELGR